jgi:hypothetical protein
VIFFRRSKEGRTPRCPRSDKTVTGSNNQKRKRHRNVQRQIGLSKEERTPTCPLADRAGRAMKHRDLLLKSAERGRHGNVQGQIWLLIGDCQSHGNVPQSGGARDNNLAAQETTIDVIGKVVRLVVVVVVDCNR